MGLISKTETLKNNSEIEITQLNSLLTVTTKTVNPGFDNEKKIFQIQGRSRLNSPTPIATLKFSAAQNKRFLKAPSLKSNETNQSFSLNSQLNMNLMSTDSDENGNITSYTYLLIYTAKEKTSKTNPLRYNFTSEQKGIVTKTTGIERVICGESIVAQDGETRKITIHGDPNETFKLALNKFTGDRDTDDNPLNGFESTILNSSYHNSTYENINIIDSRLDSSGRYSFTQVFPSATSETRYSIHFLPTNIKANFQTSYWEKSRPGWENWYSKIFTQYINPTLTLRVSKTNANYGINGGATSVHTYDYTYKGLVNTIASKLNVSYKTKFTLTYTLVAPSHSIRTLSAGGTSDNPHGLPIFSNSDSNKSDWTNSVSADNGGTIISIFKINATGSGTATYVLKVDVDIMKFGTKNTTMVLDLDTVVETV